MDFRKLEAFCKVYECRSFSNAGLELHLSQPTISAHVAALEEALGMSLFDRLGRTVLPTRAAEVLYKSATEIFMMLRGVQAELATLRDTISGTFTVGGSTIPANYILPESIAAFLKQYPEVRVEMRSGDTDEIVDLVSRGLLDVGLVGAEPDYANVSSVPVLVDELVAVASSKYRACEANNLLDWPWIARESGSGTRRTFEQALERRHKGRAHLNVVVSTYGSQAALALACAGAGVAVVSRLAAKDALSRGELIQLDMGLGPIKRSFHLVRREGRRPFPAVQAFVEQLLRLS